MSSDEIRHILSVSLHQGVSFGGDNESSILEILESLEGQRPCFTDGRMFCNHFSILEQIIQNRQYPSFGSFDT